MSTPFEALGLAAPLLRAVADLGYTHATPVQAQAIPAAMQGADWLVGSQTGSGKTAAFLLPALHRIIEQGPTAIHRVATPRVLVLCPTRELTQQVAAEAIRLVRHVKKLRIGQIVGGVAFGQQIAALKGADLVVATPGRLLDLAQRRQIRLDMVQCLVVDEADRMLDLGFQEDLTAIHEACADRDQTLMFSATFAPRIVQLASRVMRDPQRIELANAQDRHADIEQRLHWTDDANHKKRLLAHYLSASTLEQAVIFASTQIETEALARELANEGHQVAP
ncbi:MAG TPA: DEAD/DEAH box helicase, partial [Burkholderiaceae bacterium]|nr:DEAD/DEAH box helicase [Burkholderiaceae bacterium]